MSISFRAIALFSGGFQSDFFGRSGLNIEQLRRRAPEDVGLFVVAEGSRSQDRVDRVQFPRVWIIAAQHDLACADLRHQMADRFRREDQRVEIDLLEIFRRLLLQLDVGIASLRADQAGMIGTIGIGGQEAAAMGGDHLQPGIAVERALEDQMRKRDRRSQRIADGVAEPAIAGKALVEFRDALRVDEQGHAEFFRLGPYGKKFWIGKFQAVDAVSDRGALQTLLLNGGLEFLYREIGRLQGERGEGGEPVRLGGAEFGEFLVLDLDDLRAKVAL